MFFFSGWARGSLWEVLDPNRVSLVERGFVIACLEGETHSSFLLHQHNRYIIICSHKSLLQFITGES